jgi:quinoprotein glucose dehydrogenase
MPDDMPIEYSPNYGTPAFKAYDKATGEIVWETELPAGTTGNPISYLHEGKQYIVVAIGSAELGPQFIALALP